MSGLLALALEVGAGMLDAGATTVELSLPPALELSKLLVLALPLAHPTELALPLPPPTCPAGTGNGPTPGRGKFGVPSAFQPNCCVLIVLALHPSR